MDVWELLRTRNHPAFVGGASISTRQIKTEIEAAQLHGGWAVYSRLDTDTRAALVVSMMLDRALEALRNYDQNKKQKRQARKNAAKQRTHRKRR